MKNYFAKKSWASYVMLGVLVFAIVALAMSVKSNNVGMESNPDYEVTAMSGVIAMDVIAIILAAFAFAADGLFTGKLFSIIVDVAKIAAAGLLLGSLAIMVSSRGDMMGYVWFSNFDGSALTATSLNSALISWIFYALAIVADAVSLGVTVCVKKEAKAEANAETAAQQ